MTQLCFDINRVLPMCFNGFSCVFIRSRFAAD